MTNGPGKYNYYFQDFITLWTLGVRAFALRNKIDINSITGTAKGGRVTKEDILNAMQGNPVKKVRSTPAVRAFAKDHDLDINQI